LDRTVRRPNHRLQGGRYRSGPLGAGELADRLQWTAAFCRNKGSRARLDPPDLGFAARWTVWRDPADSGERPAWRADLRGQHYRQCRGSVAARYDRLPDLPTRVRPRAGPAAHRWIRGYYVQLSIRRRYSGIFWTLSEKTRET